MQKEFDIFKGVCHVIIVDMLNLKNKLITSSVYDNNNLKNKYISSLQDRINKINEYVSVITDCYNNSKNEFASIVKKGHLNSYLGTLRLSLESMQLIIKNYLLATNKDIVISDNDDVPVKAEGIGRYYSKDLAQSIIDEYPSLHFGNKQFLPDLIVDQHKSDRKLNNNGMSGARYDTTFPNYSSNNDQQMSRLKTKNKDTVIDVDKIGRGLTTPMVGLSEMAVYEFNSHLYKTDTIRKHYYAKSKPIVSSEVAVENLPTNDGKANTKDIVL